MPSGSLLLTVSKAARATSAGVRVAAELIAPPSRPAGPARRSPLPTIIPVSNVAAEAGGKSLSGWCPWRGVAFVVGVTARNSRKDDGHEPELRIPAVPGRAAPDASRGPGGRRA